MVLTDRQRADLHVGIYEYLVSRGYDQVAEAFRYADPTNLAQQQQQQNNNINNNGSSNNTTTKTPLLEKKWTAIPRLQKKVLELERTLAQSAKIHAHRTGLSTTGAEGGDQRRMLPRQPCLHQLSGHAQVVTSVALHPVFTVVVSGSEDGTVKVWDHESGEYMRTLKGHTNTVNAVTFTPRGTHLASCSTDLSIKLWDFTTFSCLRTLRGHDHTISSVKFLPSFDVVSQTNSTSGFSAALAGAQHLLSASRDHTVKLWDAETGFCDHTFFEHNDWVRCLAVRQCDGALWASAGNDQVIHVYGSSKNHVVELRGHEHVVESLSFVCEEALKDNKQQQRDGSTSTKHTQMIRDYLASGSRDRSVKLWKISEATCLATFKAHENWVRSVVIHPSGNYIISSSDDKSIRVFDIKANRCLRTLEKAHGHFVTSVDMHPTLPILVSGGVDHCVRCWQLD